MSTGGQVVGGVVGAVAGFLLGGGPTGALYGAQIGIMAGGYLDPPKGPTVTGPRLNDLTVQTSTYGAVIPRVYGTVTVNGNVIWLQGNALTEVVTKKKSGGKGGGSKTTTKTFTYSATFAVGLCEGPVVGVRRIWVGPDLIYDAGSTDPDTIAASNASAEGFALYLGTNTQAPDPRIQADVGVDNTPAWRGLAYIVFYDFALARYSNSLMGSQVRVELVKAGTIAPSETTVTVATETYKRGVKWDGARFYGVGYDNRTVIYSDSAGAWHSVVLASGAGYTDILYNGDVYLAVTDGTPSAYARSRDLVNWTYGDMPGASWIEWRCITLGPSKEMLVIGYDNIGGMSPGWVCKTTDGVTWTDAYSLGFPVSRDVQCVWNGAVWCMAYQQATGPVAYFATAGTDGLIWSQVVAPAPIDTPSGLCANGRTLLAIGYDSGGTEYSTISTDDGATWGSLTALPATTFGFWRTVAHNGTEYASLTDNGTEWISSVDGLTWTTHSLAFALIHAGPLAWNGYQWAAATWPITYEAISRVRLFGWSTISPSTVALSSIVSAECLTSGLLESGDIDVTALTSHVRGYRIGSIGALRAAIEPLQAAWPFDVRQHGYKVQFVARGGASVVTIPAADLDARAGGAAPGVQITTSREMDSQIARRVTVQHLDYAREYDAGSQYAERLNTDAVNALVLDLPIVMTSAEAAGVAEVLLYVYWLERHDVVFALPPTYNQLEPGDVVTLTTPEGDISLRLTGVSNTSDGRVECTAKYASAAVYTPAALGEPSAVTGTTTIAVVGESRYALLDVPLVHSLLESPGFLAGMYGRRAGWTGGVLVRSVDSGATWADVQAFVAPGSTMGHAVDTIGAVDSRMIDKASRLTISLYSGELYSITEMQMLAGGNHFAYGAHGRWEIIAAQACALQGNGNYILSDLLRGRYGTEWAMSLHAADDDIVLLDTDDLAVIGMSSAQIGLSFLYRGITEGADVSTDTDRAFAYAGANLECLSPVYFSATQFLGSTDWVLSWIRRSRTDGAWRDLVDVPLGEATEAYEVDIFSDASFATRLRTISASSATCTYTAAQQTADFGAQQNTIYAKVYQLSAVVGRGQPASATFVAAGNDLYWAYVSLLMPLTGTNGGTSFPDVKGHSPITAVGNAQTSTARSPLGIGSSALFDGSGDGLDLPTSSDFAFGTGDFTVEAWLYCTNTPSGGFSTDMVVFGRHVATECLFFLDNATRKPVAWDGTTAITSASAVPLNTWTFVQWVRSGGVMTIGINGVSTASGTFSTNFTASSSFHVGSADSDRWYWGNISQLRVTKRARVLELPTAAFPTY